MKTIVYQKNYEEITVGTITYSVHYVYSPDELVAMIVRYDSANVSYEKVYGVVTNHQGSIMALYDTQGKIVWETSYDAWGRERSIAGVSYAMAVARPPWLIRGYTGHEHLAEFGLINMNGRMYDPQLGRMLSPDNFVQSADATQTYNRYSYALNNPLRYRDPSGEFIFTLAALIAAPLTGGASLSLLPAAIGADFGMWQGGTLANGTTNPFKWDYSSGKTWSYMLAGAAVGAASGYIGGEVAASGMPFANTMAMVAGSVVNSMGTALYTNLQTDVTISFGAGSFNVSNGTVSGLWDWGDLSKGEKIGYSLGALGNVSDVLSGFKPGNVELQTENMSDASGKDLIGHSQLNHNGDVLIDFGPTGDWAKFEPGRNDWINYASGGKYKLISEMPGNRYSPINIQGVNVDRLYQISARMNSKPGFYQVLTRNCCSTVSRALTISGVPAIGIHPYILHAQMYLRNIGVRPTLYSYYFLYNH